MEGGRRGEIGLKKRRNTAEKKGRKRANTTPREGERIYALQEAEDGTKIEPSEQRKARKVIVPQEGKKRIREEEAHMAAGKKGWEQRATNRPKKVTDPKGSREREKSVKKNPGNQEGVDRWGKKRFRGEKENNDGKKGEQKRLLGGT